MRPRPMPIRAGALIAGNLEQRGELGMVPSHRKSPCSPAASALVWTLLTMAWPPMGGAAWAQQSTDIRLSRYTTASAVPDVAQVDPLEAVVQVSFPRAGVATVGDAVNYLLLRTGYRLAAQREADAPASAVLSMPLPEVHRQLGPYSVRTALSVLLGTPFALYVDPMQRLVSYRTTSPAVPGISASIAEAPGAERAVNGHKGSSR
jgi:conjugative transfer region protein (TIGR03748 family)